MDYLDLVRQKKEELSDLHKRMDEDRNLVNLGKYVLTDVNDNKIPNAVSITLNDMAVFASHVEASLNSASEQVCVETEDKNLDTNYIEDFITAFFRSANSKLVKTGRFEIEPFLDQQMCRRGRGAARVLPRIKDGILTPDIVPWDTRYVYYSMGADGLKWAAVETVRTKDVILAEYPDAKLTDRTSTITDIWDAEHNEVYLNKEQILEQKHSFGQTPVCTQLVSMGSMLADENSLKYQGESIFYLVRDLIPELHRLVSIIQSLNLKELDHALLWKSQGGVSATPPTHENLTQPGKVTATDVGGGAEPVYIGQLKEQAQILHTMIETRIQRGSVSNLDLGIMGNQPWSAVSLVELGEGRDKVFLPRIGARGLLKQQIAEMFIDQVIKNGTSVEIGTRGHNRKFDYRKLDGEYNISFKYFIKSPKIDAARFSMAAAAGDLIPDKAKRRDILQREDPDDDERQLRWEEAERLSPAIKMNRTIRNLVEMAERGDRHAEFEAELLSAEMGVNLKQMLSGNVTQQPTPEKPQKPQPMMPMFESSNKKSAQLQATPRGE